jgi:sugar porter (SP) family MFS transporter
MNGLFQTGGFLGTLCLPLVADRWGRKWAIAFSAILIIVSGAFLGGSVNVGEFIFFRFIAGAGAFMILAAVPIWMSEVVPSHIRGALVDIHAVLLVIGYMMASWFGLGFFYVTSPSAWRGPLCIQCVWPLLLLAGLYWIPESPRWLIMQGRHEEAQAILNRLHSNAKDPENSYARAEFYQIEKQVQIDSKLNTSWVHIFKKPSYRKRAFLAMGTCAIIQCSGVLVINNYGPILYKTLGYSTVQQIIYPAAWLTFAVGMNALAMLFVDRFPRPKYMAFGVFGCMVSLSCEAAIVATFIPSTNYTALRAGVAMLFVFQVFYSLCLDGTQFSYLNELFPTHLRAKGVCLGVSIISLMNIIWLQSAPVAFERVGWRFYLALIIPGTIGTIIMWIYFPDTKGLPLEEVAAIFGDADEVAVYQREIEIDHTTHAIVDHHNDGAIHVGGNDIESSGDNSLKGPSKVEAVHEEKQL